MNDEIKAWHGWATQSPGKLPKLWGEKHIAELNFYPEEGQRLIFLSEQHVVPLDDSTVVRYRRVE